VRLVLSLGVAMAFLWIVPGCGERSPQAAVDAASARAPEPPKRTDGVVIADDRQLKVVPFVMHDPHLDLFVRCQLKRDGAKREGKTIPLCFDPTRRSTDGIARLVVQKTDGDMGLALRRLAAVDDGAHFVVEKTGTVHQLLDVAYTARRDGALRPDEIRVVACHDVTWKALADELTRLFPGLRLEVSDLPPLPPPPTAPAPGDATAPDPGETTP